MDKPIITLKKINVHESLSHETYAYTADIYVDGVKWATVENSGQGGCDRVYPLGNYGEIDEVESRIKATYPRVGYDFLPEGMENSLELICGEIVENSLVTTH